MKTYMAKKGEIAATWHLVDASDKVLGAWRPGSRRILMGKHRVEYTPHVGAMGDFVVVINAAKVKVTGSSKLAQHDYQSFSGYPGGQKSIPLKEMLARHPDRVVSEAVRRMLPEEQARPRDVQPTEGVRPHRASSPASNP